jgi:hypothetical protein
LPEFDRLPPIVPNPNSEAPLATVTAPPSEALAAPLGPSPSTPALTVTVPV